MRTHHRIDRETTFTREVSTTDTMMTSFLNTSLNNKHHPSTPSATTTTEHGYKARRLDVLVIGYLMIYELFGQPVIIFKILIIHCGCHLEVFIHRNP